jgi:hypothetical protein
MHDEIKSKEEYVIYRVNKSITWPQLGGSRKIGSEENTMMILIDAVPGTVAKN